MTIQNSGSDSLLRRARGFISGHVLHADHKDVGLQYLWLALASVFLGMAMSLLMRIHLVWPGVQLPFLAGLTDTPDRYAALTTLHGSLMVFLVLTAAPQSGFGNYFLPLQIGARDTAFPTLNRLSLWATILSVIGMTSAFFASPENGIRLWIVSVSVFCLASLAGAVNLAVTTIELRAEGMKLSRLPVTVWAWFINAILGMLIFSILLGACVLILSDRLLGAHFFNALNMIPNSSASTRANISTATWQRLFWFFAQAEVYIAILPCFGFVSHVLSIFSRRPVWKERTVVLALCAVGVFGFCVWGQHAFATGLNPDSPLVFSLLAASLGLPSSILLVSWLATIWKAKIQLNTATLFALGFVSLFLSGGVSGIFLSRQDLESVVVSDDFVTGHFHLVMGVAATFAILAAFFFWFPKMFGRRLNESWGKVHFWLTFVGVYAVFMPMHWLGLISHSRITPEVGSGDFVAAISAIRIFVTIAAFITVAAQSIFLLNFLWSLLRGEEVRQKNPWCAATLEWSIASPPAGNFGKLAPRVFRGAYELSSTELGEEFIPQDVAPDRGEVRAKQSISSKAQTQKWSESH